MTKSNKTNGENELTRAGVNRLTGFELAVEYIENNITSRLDYDEIAKYAYCSNYHFQRIFAIYSGCTLGEYIRARKMTLAAADLKNSDAKIIDVALKYGYENSESFSRAFTKFHGIKPSQAKDDGASLKSFSRLADYESVVGGNMLDYKIKHLDALCLCGFKRKFHGVPYGEERKKQEKQFFESTKMKQWIVNGISSASSQKYKEKIFYALLDGFCDDGYDFYYAQLVDEDFFSHAQQKDIRALARLNIRQINILPTAYAVFKTSGDGDFSREYLKLCRQILCEWSVSTNFQPAKKPEIIVRHLDKCSGFAEIYIPLEEQK